MMAGSRAFTLDTTIFNPKLYARIQQFWFADVPLGTIEPSESANRRWFNNPDKDDAAAFDRSCAAEFGHQLEALGPSKVSLPSALSYDTEKNDAASIAAPFLPEFEVTATQDVNAAAKNALSIIVLLDQLSRNVFRSNQGVIYSHYDLLSRSVLRTMLSSHRLDLAPSLRNEPMRRLWFYIPLMHSEHREDHATIKILMNEWKAEAQKAGSKGTVDRINLQLDFEKQHAEIIDKFGRYPYRNECLGRTSTKEELKWIEDGGTTFGA